MNRNHSAKKISSRLRPQELSKKTAIHEAGHAAAIHLANKQKQLPPVFFRIYFQEPQTERSIRGCFGVSNENKARIEGGRLIPVLPSSIREGFQGLTDEQQSAYLRAFEADIVNLLVGPLAEAKYVVLSDNEPITPRLVNLDSLHNYGGSSDLKAVNEYLDCMLVDEAEKKDKVFDLFLAAYEFINDRANWKAINALADYLLQAGKTIVDCEEAMVILDNSSIL